MLPCNSITIAETTNATAHVVRGLDVETDFPIDVNEWNGVLFDNVQMRLVTVSLALINYILKSFLYIPSECGRGFEWFPR